MLVQARLSGQIRKDPAFQGSARLSFSNPACLKGGFAKGRFLVFDVLRGEAHFVLSRFLGGFILSPIQESLTQTPRRKKC